jgi:hypothetical protein
MPETDVGASEDVHWPSAKEIEGIQPQVIALVSLEIDPEAGQVLAQVVSFLRLLLALTSAATGEPPDAMTIASMAGLNPQAAGN